MLKKLLKNPNLLILIILSLAITWPVFIPGYFFHHDDLHVMRIFEMRKCFEDLQIPCRWVPDMGWGNGYPLFNYYSALPYYIGGLFSYFISFVNAAKSLFFISVFFAGISMYLLGNKLFGKDGGLITAVLYLFAPYRALDIFVRGAIAESFALALVPLFFYFSLRLIEKVSVTNFLALSFSLAAFLLSHNIMTMIFMPFFIIWVVFWTYTLRFKVIATVFLSTIFAFGLSAFFLLPAFFEKSLVQSENLIMGGFQYWIHYVSVSQLFLDRSWKYGHSGFGVGDTISFQIGWPHWLLVLILTLVIALKFKKLEKQKLLLGILIILVFLISIFMTHNKSTFIWQLIPILQYTQFPWRFLGLSIFAASLIGGLLITQLKQSLKKPVVFTIIILTVLLNFLYFKPADFYESVTDKTKLSGSDWELQQKASITDYLPVTAHEPERGVPAIPEVVSGKAKIENFSRKSNSFKFDALVSEKINAEIPVYDFPNWSVFVDGQKVIHGNGNYLGRISIDLEEGNHQVEGKFLNTPIRATANFITIASFVILILLPLYGKIRKNRS